MNRTLLTVLGLVLLFALSVAAEDQRTALQITPQVAQRGTEVTVVLEGHNLDQVIGILPYSKGIRFLRTEPATEVFDHSFHGAKPARPGRAINLVLQIDDDCAIGEHLFRVRLKHTLSEFQALWVSPYRCVPETHLCNAGAEKALEKDKFEFAQQVDLNPGTTVWGFFPAYSNFDQDFYSVDLKPGERVTAEVWGTCLSNSVDAAMTLYGPDQKPIITVDDTTLRGDDPFLSYIAKTAGTHYVVVHPYNDGENTRWSYVVHFSGGTRPTLSYPLGGPVGTEMKATLFGDPKGEAQTNISLPKAAGRYEQSMLNYRVAGSVLPLHLSLADFPNVLEQAGDHGTPEKAQKVEGELPIALNGKIETEGETDWFRFRARKGQRFLVRTFAATCGSPLDPIVKIRAAEGTDSAIDIEADDSEWIDHDLSPIGRWRAKDLADPIVVFEADADGDYLLGIADNQRLFGPDFLYRVEFQPAHDRIWLQNTADYRESFEKRDTIVIHSGNTIERTYNIKVPPITKFDGEFDIVVKGLPKGVTYTAPRADRDTRIVQLTFSAASGTPPWAGFPQIEFRPVDAEAKLGGGYFYLHTRNAGRGGISSGFYRKTRRFALAVVDPAPIAVRLTQPEVGLAKSAFLDLDVHVDRAEGFEGPVVLRAIWTPAHVTPAPPLTIPAGESKATYRLTAGANAAPGSHLITVTANEANETGIGSATTGLNQHFVSAPPVKVTIVGPYLKVTLARTAIERGKQGVIKATVEHLRPLPGKTTATLSNLPTGVELLGDIEIRAGMTDIELPIRATSAALLGQASGIACHVTITENGQPIVQSAGVATLRIDEERK